MLGCLSGRGRRGGSGDWDIGKLGDKGNKGEGDISEIRFHGFAGRASSRDCTLYKHLRSEFEGMPSFGSTHFDNR